jgi:hypothetical protein
MANKALMDLHDQGMEAMKVQNKTGYSLGIALLDAFNAEGHATNMSQLRRALLIAERWDDVQLLDGFPDVTVRDAMNHLRDYA